MESETKHLREKLNAFQIWMEDEIEAGHIDMEQTPPCFDRARYALRKEEKDTHTIGSRCHFCNNEFLKRETRHTTNHIMWFHYSCQIAFDKAEEDALTRQEKYD